ncbi:MAG: LamB/YcsF family protein [bacterium]
MIPLSSIKKEQNQNKQILLDLNCDLGQSFGVYKNELEMGLLPYVSSVSVSCGGHAGDPVTLMRVLKIAKEKNIAVGAHIGYPDLQGFGYRLMQLNDEEMQSLVLYQLGALYAMAKAYEVTIEHVRPHGALYVQACQDEKVAVSLCKAIMQFDKWLILVAAPSKALYVASEQTGLRYAPELLLDKKYDVDGCVDFDAGNVDDEAYQLSLLETAIKELSVKNTSGGKTKLDLKSIHLTVKDEKSIELAKRAKTLIGQPMPIPVNFVGNSGWVL